MSGCSLNGIFKQDDQVSRGGPHRNWGVRHSSLITRNLTKLARTRTPSTYQTNCPYHDSFFKRTTYLSTNTSGLIPWVAFPARDRTSNTDSDDMHLHTEYSVGALRQLAAGRDISFVTDKMFQVLGLIPSWSEIIFWRDGKTSSIDEPGGKDPRYWPAGFSIRIKLHESVHRKRAVTVKPAKLQH